MLRFAYEIAGLKITNEQTEIRTGDVIHLNVKATDRFGKIINIT